MINKYLYLFIIAAVVIILLIILIFIIKRPKKTKLIIDEEFINNIMNLLGQGSNIEKISVDNARLKIVVKNLKSVDLEGLKDLSKSGVFVTANTIKILFKYDSADIKNKINKLL